MMPIDFPDPYQLARLLTGHPDDAAKLLSEAKRSLGVNRDDVERQTYMLIALSEKFRSHRTFTPDTLDWYLQQLTPARRVVWALKEVFEMVHEDVGSILGVSPGTVRSRYHRAKKTVDGLRESHWTEQLDQARSSPPPSQPESATQPPRTITRLKAALTRWRTRRSERVTGGGGQ